jgi:hypothetical protein
MVSVLKEVILNRIYLKGLAFLTFRPGEEIKKKMIKYMCRAYRN